MPKTNIVFVVDRSGSMEPMREFVVKNFNEQVQEFQRRASEGQDITVSLVTFSGEVFVSLWRKPASDLELSTLESYKVGGSTALRDAIGYSIKRLGESDENEHYLLLVLTDGEENASQHISASELKELIEDKQKRENWTITMMGCSAEYLGQLAKDTSIPLSNMAAYSPVSAGQALRHTRARTAVYLSAVEKGGQHVNSGFHSFDNVVADLVVADKTTTAADTPTTDTTTAIPIGTADVFSATNKANWDAWAKPDDKVESPPFIPGVSKVKTKKMGRKRART